MNDLNRVTELAKQIREAFEEIRGKQYGSGLGGLCARASTQLYLAAKRLGIDNVDMCVGSGHVYCMYGEYVIDVTATQFGVKDRVFVTRLLDLPEVVKGQGRFCTAHAHWQQSVRFWDLEQARQKYKNEWWHCSEEVIRTDMEYVKKYTGELPLSEPAQEAVA